MRKVELRMKEQTKYNAIKEYVDHGGNKNKLALKLSISRRQVDRLIIKYKENGESGFVHGNRSRKPVNVLDKSLSEDIILLYKNKYQDWNFTHFKEFLEKMKISMFLIILFIKHLKIMQYYLLRLGRKLKETWLRKNYLKKRK